MPLKLVLTTEPSGPPIYTLIYFTENNRAYFVLLLILKHHKQETDKNVLFMMAYVDIVKVYVGN